MQQLLVFFVFISHLSIRVYMPNIVLFSKSIHSTLLIAGLIDRSLFGGWLNTLKPASTSGINPQDIGEMRAVGYLLQLLDKLDQFECYYEA